MRKNLKEYFIMLITLCFCIINCTGFYSQQYIDDIALVIALGLDVGENNTLKMTVQISLPSKEVGTSDSGSSGSSENTTKIHSVECNSIDSGINILNSFISKRINLSHCKSYVFSEEIAKRGLSEYIYSLINEAQVRPDSSIIISKCSAEDFIKNSKPSLDELTAKYYEIAPSSSEYTGYTENIKLIDFFSAIKDSFREPCAILGSISSESAKNSTNNSSSPYPTSSNEKDSSYIAGQTPVSSDEISIENVGLAVFNGDALIGELNAIETICHLIITNELHTCTITIPNPFDSNSNIDLFVKLKNNTQRRVYLLGNSPYIECDISLTSRILSMNKSSNYVEAHNLDLISSYANSYLEYQIKEYLYKTSKDFKSDIDNFGKNAVSKFLTIGDWKKYNWLDSYKNSFFNVSVDCDVKSAFLLLET